MKDYDVVLSITLEANNKEEAIEKFWNIAIEDKQFLSLDINEVSE